MDQLPKNLVLRAEVVDQHDSGGVILNIGGAQINLPKSAIEAAMPAPSGSTSGATQAP